MDDQSDLSAGALWLRAQPNFNSNTWAVVDGRVMNENMFGAGGTDGVLREGYVAFRTPDADLRFGKQILAWGRADQLNPTDNLSPKDYTLLTATEADQRSGTPAAQASIYRGDLSLALIWLARFHPNVLPFPPSTAALSFHEHEPPDQSKQWAAKLDESGGTLDWSLSYFNGFDLNPDLAIDDVSPTGPVVGLYYHRIRVFGADAATTFGSYNLRGEAAYTLTENPLGTDPGIKSPFFYAVLGGDRTFIKHLNINLQYFLHVVSQYHNPEDIADPIVRAVAVQQAVINNQFDRTQGGVTLRLSDHWLNETLSGEIAAIYTFSRHSYLIRPKVSYAFTDRWSGILGADIFRGDENTFLGRLRDNSTAYLELRYGF
ncbi:MAG: DUF1302 family protein [Acidiferrobacterales bacterium]